MKLQKNKTLTSAALILILAAATLMATIPAVSAHDPPWDINTFGFISVAPDTVGVNQQVIMYMWLHIVPPTASGPYGDRWKGFTLDVTKPDASVETLGPFNSDPIGFAWTLYTPTQIGTYSLQFHYPGQVLEGENLDPNDDVGQEFIGDYYQPCSSGVITLTVQQDQIPAYPDTPLPTDYWDRPIDGQHRDWWSISGNWLRAPGRNWVPPNMYVPYSNGPETPHILWANSLTSGGLVGGEFGTNSFHDGNAYEGKFMPVIIAGRLYYNQNPDDIYANRPGRYPAGEPWTVPKEGVYSVDLRTGEEYWFTDEFRLAFGQIYQYDSPNQHGAFAYLWEVDGSTWNGFEAFNGQWIYTIENVPGGTHTVGPDGSIYKYQLDTRNDRLTLWSNTAMTDLVGGPTGTHYWQWRPQGKTVDGSTGYLWNVSIPADLPGGINVVLEDRIIGSDGFGALVNRQYMGT
ncbi:hypothetical protein KAI12_02585, partial [Candidatus Bathyarchaeota archaeon]|nr:hypothetical protein [Candidatus Bathyarchaeota archaeon]